jgi:HTH-type transcriptional regulator/antitoxin HigA
MNMQIDEAITHWPHVAPLLQPARSEAAYHALVEALDAVLDAGGSDESHPMARLADYLGDLVAQWEAQDAMPSSASSVEVLHFLIDQHGLKQTELTEIGSQGVVSEVLNGKRKLNLRQIRALSQRFSIPAQMFI